MINLKKSAIYAGAMAISAMLAVMPAKAVVVTSSGVTGGCANSIPGAGVGQIDVLAGASWNAEFNNGDAGGSCLFDFNNTSASAAAVTISVATVNQGLEFWGFNAIPDSTDGVVLTSQSGVLWSLLPGQGGFNVFNFLIGAGQTVWFDWTWGQAYATGNTKPDIDFSVSATPVPVPAALPLLVSALLGLGFLARRRKGSVRV